MDVELQQRAVEYLSLERRPELARANVTPMPPWEKRKSLLLRRMAEREVCGPTRKLLLDRQRCHHQCLLAEGVQMCQHGRNCS